MRILLDECVPRRLKKAFRDYGVVLTVTVAFVLLRARSNDIVDIEPLLPRLFERWAEIAKRSLLIID